MALFSIQPMTVLDSGATFGADVSGLKQSPGVWFDDAFFTDDTGTVTLTNDEEKEVKNTYQERRQRQ